MLTKIGISLRGKYDTMGNRTGCNVIDKIRTNASFYLSQYNGWRTEIHDKLGDVKGVMADVASEDGRAHLISELIIFTLHLRS